jgi:hypothetical protein
MHNDFLVYEHWRSDKNVPFYVGKSNERKRRATNMSNRSERHKRLTAKLRREGHQVIVKIVDRNLPEESAFLLERMRISTYRAARVELVNFTDGGEGVSGWRADEVEKARRSRVQSEAQSRPEVRARRSAALKGKPKSAEARRKMSENNSMGRPEVREKAKTTRLANGGWKPPTPELVQRWRQEFSHKYIGAGNPFFGKKHSEETRAKMRAARARQKAQKELGGSVAAPGSGN